MINDDVENYLKALKSKPNMIKNVEMSGSERKKAWIAQGGKCANCKETLSRSYLKYIKDPKTKTMKILCSSCAIPSIKRL
jgi:hypothetical protein